MPISAASSILSFFPLLGILLLAGGCDSPSEATPRLALTGTVVRTDTNAPAAGAKVALVRYGPQDGVPGREIVAEVVADAGGRYTLSHPAAEGECDGLVLQATVDDWRNPNVSSETSRELECHSGVQRVDLRLVFSAF
ncbi:MAG TPA: hypothetical protein VF615_16320 [Longimicrobiaceae bacterium]|jgi:5-hydroxyisourate hydrolase-like protein (transthyretin family)